jgi:hypothetical protein
VTALDEMMTKLGEDPEMRNDVVGTFLTDTADGDCGFCGWTRNWTHNNTEAAEEHARAELDAAAIC